MEHVDQSRLLDDQREPAGIQHTLILDDAILAREGYDGMSASRFELPRSMQARSSAEDLHS